MKKTLLKKKKIPNFEVQFLSGVKRSFNVGWIFEKGIKNWFGNKFENMFVLQNERNQLFFPHIYFSKNRGPRVFRLEFVKLKAKYFSKWVRWVVHERSMTCRTKSTWKMSWDEQMKNSSKRKGQWCRKRDAPQWQDLLEELLSKSLVKGHEG